MACILLVDPNETARRAMSGILARGDHRLACVNDAAEAWAFIRQNVKVDLVFVELDLPGNESGLGLIQKMKDDCVLKLLPLVVYTAKSDRECVKRCLELRVQNFLLKPYHDDDVFSELAKTETNPWFKRHFEEEKTFCQMMGYEPADLRRMLGDIRTTVAESVTVFNRAIELKAPKLVEDQVKYAAEIAEAAGAWGVVECLNSFVEPAQADDWASVSRHIESLDFAANMIGYHLDDSIIPAGFQSHRETNAEIEARERAVWKNAPAEQRCPVVEWPRLQREMDALPGCPVVDSAAAAFQMMANGHPSCINPLMDLVEKDPGLSAQMLIVANKAKSADEDDFTTLEDPRLAVGQLGEIRLESLARSLAPVEERHFEMLPAFNWPRYLMFQTGVARIAKYTCGYLEFYSMEPIAQVAGLLHDIGKLLLARLHPYGFQAIIEYAREKRVPLGEAEKIFLGCTTHEMGAHFADKTGLPRRYANVMRWINNPENATEDQSLIAIISLARNLCRQYQLGASGDPPKDKTSPIEESAEWRVLREHVFPSFNLKKFETQVLSDCRQLRMEFAGRQANYAPVASESALAS